MPATPVRAGNVHPVVDQLVRFGMLAVGAYSLAMTGRGLQYLLGQSADDAAYYLEIAENAATGHGFTFDRLAPTNGFHPLWAWVLVALRRVFVVEPEIMLALVWALQCVLMTVSSWLLWRMLHRHVGSWPAALGAVLFVGRLYYTGRGGMESALLLFLVVVLLDRADRWRPDGLVRAIGLGVLAGLCMLARLDTLFVAGAVGAAWCLGADGARARVRLALAVFVSASATVLPYLVSNLRDFGHLVPISGMLKSSYPHPGWHVAAFNVQGQDALVLGVATFAAVLVLVVRFLPGREPGPAFVRRLVPAVCLGVLAHLLYSALFMKWGIFGWHFVLARLALALALPLLVLHFLPTDARAGRMLWPAGVLLVALASALPIVRRDWRTDYAETWAARGYEAALWVQRATPPDAILAMRDSGVFGYFCRRRVVNVDGLVNSFAYQDSLAAGRFVGFLRSRGVDYFVQHAVLGRPDVNGGRYDAWRFDSWTTRFDRTGGSLTLRHVDEVYRSRPYPHGAQMTVFLIWRMPPP